jgi:hypothetical protein
MGHDHVSPPFAAIADEAPAESDLTDYDLKHFSTYLRLLDADAEGVESAEAARTLLHIDPSLSLSGHTAHWDSHLARAKWLMERGYRKSGLKARRLSTNREPRAFLLDCADEFHKATGFSRSKIGQRALHDPAFSSQVQAGRHIKIRTFETFIFWLDEHWSRPLRSRPRLIAAGLSVYEPDPVRTLEVVAARQAQAFTGQRTGRGTAGT